MESDFQVCGTNSDALFTLKLHRGDGMCLIAMNWKEDKPPEDFVGFAIQYMEPGGTKFFTLKNRICFPNPADKDNSLPTMLSPIQKFRWVHFPRNADMAGEFTYTVTPVFMNDKDELSYGESQKASIALCRETYPGKLNIAFTRGFVSSQAFVDRYEPNGELKTLIPTNADDGLTFVPTHPDAQEAYDWMGFEARKEILNVLDKAVEDTDAQVRVIAYDLNEPEVVTRLEKLGSRLKVIIDNEGSHGKDGSGENQSEQRLITSAGAGNVKRQHMGGLQHNKTIVVNGPQIQASVCGSTNFSWRGFFIQNNNAMVLYGSEVVKQFSAAFDNFWQFGTPAAFGKTDSANRVKLGIEGIDAYIGFSPHIASNAMLKHVADDISSNVTSSLFYSLAFLYQTPGAIRNAIKKVTKDKNIFVYGISDRKVDDLSGIDLQKPNGNLDPVYPAELSKNIPKPFKPEPDGGRGIRMHHKFIVIDFDKPTARVYMGSYNFSNPADTKNGENLVLINDRRIAVSYMIEALRIFDHYHFRIAQQEAKKARKKLELAKPPRKPKEKAWWEDDYSDPVKIKDRELFS